MGLVANVMFADWLNNLFIYLFIINGFNVFIGFYSGLIRFFTVLTFNFIMIFILFPENKQNFIHSFMEFGINMLH